MHGVLITKVTVLSASNIFVGSSRPSAALRRATSSGNTRLRPYPTTSTGLRLDLSPSSPGNSYDLRSRQVRGYVSPSAALPTNAEALLRARGLKKKYTTHGIAALAKSLQNR
ncbi:unnamed protein product, partial [Mesorhabditis spiculigera]